MRNELVEFHNLYVEYLGLTYPPSTSGPPPEASRLRNELRRRMADAQAALDAAGVDLAMYPPPAFGGPIQSGLINVLFLHESSLGYTGMGNPPFFEKVAETLQVAAGALERKAEEETRRRPSPVYWLDLALTAFLGIPAYIVSRVVGVPVWKIEESPLGLPAPPTWDRARSLGGLLRRSCGALVVAPSAPRSRSMFGA